jgi:hypothetical protein
MEWRGHDIAPDDRATRATRAKDGPEEAAPPRPDHPVPVEFLPWEQLQAILEIPFDYEPHAAFLHLGWPPPPPRVGTGRFRLEPSYLGRCAELPRPTHTVGVRGCPFSCWSFRLPTVIAATFVRHMLAQPILLALSTCPLPVAAYSLSCRVAVRLLLLPASRGNPLDSK